MNKCTALCDRLRATDLKDGVLPTHDELVDQLQFSEEDQEIGRHLGNWGILRQRTSCSFCQLVVTAISQSRSQNSYQETNPEQEIRILLFPGEQSFRLSYPSRVGIRLAFIAPEFKNAVGPDTGRIICESGIQTEQIKGWLKTCDEDHEACSLGSGNPEVNDFVSRT